MALALPYRFDTTGVLTLILRGVLGLLGLVIVPGILYSLFVSHSLAAAAQLLLVGAVMAFFGRVVGRNLTGSVGTISRDAVAVVPGRLLGLRLPGPAGRFPLRDFTAVRVERIFGPLGTTQAPRPHERVYLDGSARAPDILVARTDRDAGILLGRELAEALELPYREEQVPH